MNKSKGILGVCAFACGSNMVLFFIKLYVGLSTNSISIYSDAVNNLFDSLSGLLTLICLAAVMRISDFSSKSMIKKSEQLLSFITSITVAAAGFYFAYSSAERLMYPTPVWYTEKYLVILVMTAAAKLLMWAFYKAVSRKLSSPVIKVMKVDCVLDFFITAVTVLTLILSKYESYAIDAIAGLLISTVIVVSAIKMVISQAGKLINYVPSEKREKVSLALSQLENTAEVLSVIYNTSEDKTEVYIKVKLTNEEQSASILEKVKNDCLENADVKAFFAKS